MAGRHFPYLEECTIILPHHWQTIRQYEVQLPSCKTLDYHGYPMTTVQYFHVPEMISMKLRSHDCNQKRVYQHLRHLCRVDERISRLTTLHLTIQCSEQVLIKVLKYLVSLQELHLSIAYPSPTWQNFLESLAAKLSPNEWPARGPWMADHQLWEQWCSYQTWRANVLPRLKYLSIQCPKGFSQSERLANLPLLRLVGWTRAYLTPPLEHLKVWEGRESVADIAVDYISTGYLDKHLGVSSEVYDAMIVKGMVTRCLVIDDYADLLFRLDSTLLFRQLQHLEIIYNHSSEILILPCLEQIKRLEIRHGIIPVYSLDLDLPLTHTLQWLELHLSTSSWILGRTFNALIEVKIHWSPFAPENLSRHNGLQVDLPACTILELENCPIEYFRFLSCSNVQILRWSQHSRWATFDLAAPDSAHDFKINLPCLQQLYISISSWSGLDFLTQLVFCDAREQGVWRDIKSVEIEILFNSSLEAIRFFDQAVGHQQRYEKWWKTFTVTKEFVGWVLVKINASV